MAVELNSTTPLENMIEIIEKFNLNHPGVFDDRVIKKLEILNKLKYTIFIFSYLLFIWKIHVLYRFFILLFIYLIQKNYYLWKKKNDVGKRVLERCVRKAGIADVDLRELYRAHDLIRPNRYHRRHGGYNVGGGYGGRSIGGGGCGGGC